VEESVRFGSFSGLKSSDEQQQVWLGEEVDVVGYEFGRSSVRLAEVLKDTTSDFFFCVGRV